MISQILPVFIIIAFGFLLSVVHIADDSWVRILNKFGLYAGFPFLIFGSLISVDSSVLREQIPTFFTTIALLYGFMLLLYLLIKVSRVPTDRGITYFLGGYNANTGYLGFPLILALFPASGATIGLIVAAYSICTFTLGLFLLESLSGEDKHVSEIFRYIATSPLLIAAVAGLVVVITGLTIPPLVIRTVDMIKAAASPVVLIGLGIFMHRKINVRKLFGPLTVILVTKMAIFPLLFLLIRWIFPLDHTFDIAILEASMPLAITNFALSDRYPMDKELMVSAIIISTILTPLVFPIFVALI
jgi:predicted permease